MKAFVRCRHSDAWVMGGGYGLWCPECGAWRPMKPSGDENVIVPRGGWHTPRRYKGVKPTLKLYTANAALSGGKAVRSNTLLGSGLNGSKRGVNWCIGCGHHNAPDAATCDLCGRGQK